MIFFLLLWWMWSVIYNQSLASQQNPLYVFVLWEAAIHCIWHMKQSANTEHVRLTVSTVYVFQYSCKAVDTDWDTDDPLPVKKQTHHSSPILDNMDIWLYDAAIKIM